MNIRRISHTQKLLGYGGYLAVVFVFFTDDHHSDAWSPYAEMEAEFAPSASIWLALVGLGVILLWIAADWWAERREKRLRRAWHKRALDLDQAG